MNRAAVTKNAERFVKKALAGEGTGHDWWHIERVRNNAKLILKSEKADAFVVDLALLLHDVGDRKVLHTPEDDYSIAERFLKSQKLPEGTIRAVMFIIRNMSFSKSLDGSPSETSPEFFVARDADRLDALGAIGIARAFAFGGSRGRPLYDPAKPARKMRSARDYQNANGSSLNHFEEKLFLLKDRMHTRSARRIAGKRDAYMRAYVARFLDEWRGKR